MSSSSYVRGRHKENHDITQDGFYTNYNNNGTIKTGYVGVTPPDDLYYIWQVGESLNTKVYTVNLTASKYSTLGTAELELIELGIPVANTEFLLAGFSAGVRDRNIIHK